MKPDAIHAKAIELSKHALSMTTAAGAGHPSSALSLAHVITALMGRAMRFDPTNPWHAAADRLVLSEGHAVPIVYAAYADMGGVVGSDPDTARPLTVAELDGLRELSSELDGHPNPAEGFPFFDAATGSLGMGLSVATGLAAAARLDGTDRRVYCVCGDGESREGQIWEAVDFAVDLALTNVCAIFNCNGAGQTGAVSAQQSPEKLQAKLEAFGWKAVIIDGHDADEVCDALDDFTKTRAPYAIVARTVKGWGVDTMLGHNFHGKPLNAEQLETAYASLDAQGSGKATVQLQAAAPPKAPSDRDTTPIELEPIGDSFRAAGYAKALESRKLATRRAYGAALLSLGRASERVVAVDGDVGNSTFSEIFAKAIPERFFEGRIAEQNMVSAAVGLAAGGRIPFVSTFAKFVARAYDQVELAMISRANVKIIGSHSGLGPASDGPSQMALADVAFFNALAAVEDTHTRKPACLFLQPADAVAAYRLTGVMANTPGLCYMRTHRPDGPFLYELDTAFEPIGAKILREGTDGTIITSGYMVCVALQAWEELSKQGIRCNLIDAYSLPLPEDTIAGAAESGAQRALVIEDNYPGGLEAAVCSLAARRGTFRVDRLCVRQIPKSARKPETLMDALALSPAAIVGRVREMLEVATG